MTGSGWHSARYPASRMIEQDLEARERRWLGRSIGSENASLPRRNDRKDRSVTFYESGPSFLPHCRLFKEGLLLWTVSAASAKHVNKAHLKRATPHIEN